MRDRAVVSERGTITIPEPIREITHIQPGDLIEFYAKGGHIMLRHLIVKRPEDEAVMSNNEWREFEKLVKAQLKKGQYKSYGSLEKAKLHSRKLMRKKQA